MSNNEKQEVIEGFVDSMRKRLESAISDGLILETQYDLMDNFICKMRDWELRKYEEEK